jgi:hypothetical protein
MLQLVEQMLKGSFDCVAVPFAGGNFAQDDKSRKSEE